MLQRVAPSLFHATTGETVTIAAIAQNNNGVNAAAFRYGPPPNLPQRQTHGHPGCEFVVVAGLRTFGVSAFLVPDAPNARYDLFEEDDVGNLVDLQVSVSPASGPVVQFQIDGRPVAVAAAAPPRARKKAKAPKKARAERKRKAAKKPARRRPKAAARSRRKPGARKTSSSSKKAPRKARRKGRR